MSFNPAEQRLSSWYLNYHENLGPERERVIGISQHLVTTVYDAVERNLKLKPGELEEKLAQARYRFTLTGICKDNYTHPVYNGQYVDIQSDLPLFLRDHFRFSGTEFGFYLGRKRYDDKQSGEQVHINCSVNDNFNIEYCKPISPDRKKTIFFSILGNGSVYASDHVICSVSDIDVHGKYNEKFKTYVDPHGNWEYTHTSQKNPMDLHTSLIPGTMDAINILQDYAQEVVDGWKGWK